VENLLLQGADSPPRFNLSDWQIWGVIGGSRPANAAAFFWADFRERSNGPFCAGSKEGADCERPFLSEIDGHDDSTTRPDTRAKAFRIFVRYETVRNPAKSQSFTVPE
jgi:hypothetical protein